MSMEPMPDGGILSNRSDNRYDRDGTPPLPLSAAEIDRSSRIAVLLAAMSLGLFLVVLAVLTTSVYDGAELCGSPFGGVGFASDACESRLRVRWRWAVLGGTISLSLAALAFRLRWGPGWTATRRTDDR